MLECRLLSLMFFVIGGLKCLGYTLNKRLSHMFAVENGVRQGSTLSPSISDVFIIIIIINIIIIMIIITYDAIKVTLHSK